MNFIAGRIEEGVFRSVGGLILPLPEGARPADAAGRELVYGICPEHIRATPRACRAQSRFRKPQVRRSLPRSTVPARKFRACSASGRRSSKARRCGSRSIAHAPTCSTREPAGACDPARPARRVRWREADIRQHFAKVQRPLGRQLTKHTELNSESGRPQGRPRS
ncbi:hypothetical protein [Mesorhizobium mediterraneum]|uniref:hypothetical protein n=1 Tax=Mesorhizobium mediterraneum TaxID=43617 RepID=UPI001FEE16FD|nr:hypothetical protein [Mesorhizobium mediterraneum]